MPDWTDEILSRIAPLHLGPTVEAQIIEELSQHLDDRYRDLCVGGDSPDQARILALQELGDSEKLASDLKRALTRQPAEPLTPGKPASNFLASLWHDIRYAVRLHRRNPGLTAVAMLTLAIGIGANTTVFSIVNGVLLRPLPFNASDRIVVVSLQDKPGSGGMLRQTDDQRIREAVHSFAGVCGYTARRVFSKTDEPSIDIVAAAPDCFGVFGIQPQIGRAFNEEDSKPGAAAVAVISQPFWRERFGGDPAIVGKTLSVPDSPPLTIVGVFPETFRSPNDFREPDPVWTSANYRTEDFRGYGGRIFARLKPGVSLRQAQAEINTLGKQLLPPSAGPADELAIRSLMDQYVGTARTTILIFAGAVLCVLLIVVVNLIGLELARLPSLEGELAIRTALGASRWRLTQAMVVKTLCVGLAGGIFGFAMAAMLQQTLLTRMAGIPRKEEIRLDSTVFAVSLVLTLVASLMIALIPALRASRLNVRDMVHASAPSYTAGRRTRIFQDSLTAVETGLAVVLLIGAGLFINNLWLLLSRDIGFDQHGITTIRVALPTSYDAHRQQVFWMDLLDRLKSISRPDSMALSLRAPLEGGTYTFAGTGDSDLPSPKSPINEYFVSPEYFSALRIPVVAGRTFNRDEVVGVKPVAVISTALATKLWPGKDPLGSQLKTATETWTVVGVVRDVEYGYYFKANLWSYGTLSPRNMMVATERLTLYVPISQGPVLAFGPLMRAATVVAREPANSKDVTAIISEMEPKARLTLDSVEQSVVNMTREQRFQTTVLAGFSAVALLLSAIGLYGVVSHSVGRRTREIGIRMALGAKGREVFADVCRQAIVPSVAGMLIGLGISVALQKVLSSYLYAIQPNDAPTYVIVCLVMTFVVVLAAAIPARRAGRLNPVVALRCE